MNLIFSIMGLVGGLLCCTGYLLFDLKGQGNEKLGTSKNIDSNWSKMSEYAIADMIKENNPLISNLILITGFIGCV